MNFGSSEQHDETGIELTPLIDVVFLLLIFFMISTTFTKETALKINLPEATGDQAAKKPESVEIVISANSEYAILGEKDQSAKVLIDSNRQTLVRVLEQYRGKDNLLLVVRADKKATHEAVIKVLDVAQDLGLTNLTFATKQQESN